MLLACTFLFKNINYSQNLIQNNSFENYTNPLNCYGGFDNYNASPVYHVLDNWYTLNSSDYFNGTCPNSTLFSTQQNFIGNQNAKNGIAYPGFLLYGVSYETKEYIYQQLSSPLQAGKLYCLTFYVSRADRITHAIHTIGAYFSSNVQSTGSLGYINAAPQVVNQSGFITDTLAWTQVQGCFTANGGEQYITLGNFNSNANTDTLYIGTSNQLSGADKYAYYYIDDITLIDQTTVGIKDVSYLSEVVRVYPNPVNDILNVSFATEKQGRKIELYDAIGNLLLEKDASSNNLYLTTDNLSNGVYFYTILVGEKNIKTDKVVIIK